MSNKRGAEDISPSAETPAEQSEVNSPKRSKLDFLAMIAGMSEDGGDVEEESVAATEDSFSKHASAEATKPTKDDSAAKSGKTEAPAKKPAAAAKSDTPKSSFAAWKLAKGRKNEMKSPSRKEISVGRKDLSVTSPGPATNGGSRNDLYVKSSAESGAAGFKKDFSDKKKAAAGAMSTKKSLKKDQSGIKKSLSPKKSGSSIKKDKDGLSPKKAAAKKAAALAGKNGVTKSGKTKPKKGGDQAGMKASAFPEKIMELLQGGLAPNAIYWLPEGEAIAVDPDNFKDSTVISKQFRGNKLSSFVRSLNRWGFRRIFYHSLPDKTLAFYHRLFQKQSPELVKDMKMDGGEKEPALPPGALPASAAPDGGRGLPLESPKASQPKMPAHAEVTPAASAAPMAALSQPTLSAAGLPGQESAVGVPSAAGVLEQNAMDLAAAEGQHALQQAMVAEQERSDLALQQLQAQQILLQSLAEQQNAAQAEELLMQSMLAEQQRSDLALQQRQAEQALLQQMLTEDQTSAFATALNGTGGAGVGGFDVEALLRERLLAQQYANAGAASAPAGGSDILALLQQQLQGQSQAREPSYMEQLMFLEQQQQQQQRQQEAAILAARGFRFG